MEETTIDLREVLKVIKKRRVFIGTVFIICVGAAAAVSFIIPPTYESETTLRVKQSKGLADSLLAELPVGNSANTKQLMSTYAEILKSRTVVQKVIDKTQSDKEKVPKYEDMLNRITTQPVKDTEILNIKVEASTPEEAKAVANTLVESFNERLTFLVRSQQKAVREFIGERLQESKKELEQAEDTLQKYKENQNIVAPADETKAMVDKLSALNKMAAENRVNLASAGGRLSSINGQLNNEKDGFVADSPLIQQYKGKLAELEVQLVSLKQKYTNEHPQVLAMQAAIAETREKLQVEAVRIINADAPSMNPIHQELLKGKIQSEAEIAAASAQQGAIQRVLTESGTELTKLPAKEQGLAKVMRDANVAQEIYIMLAKRHEEARISEAMEASDVQLIDAAQTPETPIKPKKMLNITLAAVLGLVSGVGMALAREYFSRTIRNAEDVKQYLGLPVLGTIPDFKHAEKMQTNGFWSRINQKNAPKMHKGG